MSSIDLGFLNRYAKEVSIWRKERLKPDIDQVLDRETQETQETQDQSIRSFALVGEWTFTQNNVITSNQMRMLRFQPSFISPDNLGSSLIKRF